MPNLAACPTKSPDISLEDSELKTSFNIVPHMLISILKHMEMSTAISTLPVDNVLQKKRGGKPQFLLLLLALQVFWWGQIELQTSKCKRS